MRSIPFILCMAFLVPPVAVTQYLSAQSDELKPEQCLGGDLEAPIRLEVFSDFECPACREFYIGTIQLVLNDYCSSDKVCVIYHEFPLPSHKYSRQAAQYSQAAQRLGRKQWLSVIHALYENQQQWNQSGSVEDVAFKALGSDEYFKLRRQLLDPSIDTTIDSDVSLGKKREVTSTPTIFIYALGREQKVVGGLPYAVLKRYFDNIVR